MPDNNSVFDKLSERMGAPGSKRFAAILEAMMTQEEGGILLEAAAPITAKELAKKLNTDEKILQSKLDSMEKRQIIRKMGDNYMSPGNIVMFHHGAIGWMDEDLKAKTGNGSDYITMYDNEVWEVDNVKYQKFRVKTKEWEKHLNETLGRGQYFLFGNVEPKNDRTEIVALRLGIRRSREFKDEKDPYIWEMVAALECTVFIMNNEGKTIDTIRCNGYEYSTRAAKDK